MTPLFMPSAAVWELTPAESPGCSHCGFLGDCKPEAELSVDACLGIVDSLAEIRVRQLLLIDGVSRQHPGLLKIIQAASARGIGCSLHTGADLLTSEFIRSAILAGVKGFGLLLDCFQLSRDRRRGGGGSFENALGALRRLWVQDRPVTVVTRIGAGNLMELPMLMDMLIDLNVSQWHVQLNVASANARENSADMLQPYQLAELMPMLAQLYKKGLERNLEMVIGNNIGYFGPYEHLWRSAGNDMLHWEGCGAGLHTLNLAADGSVAGCVSLNGDDYTGDYPLDTPLPEIWRNSKAIQACQSRSVFDLWGFCLGCYYADICKAGCTWTGYSLFKMAGNNPYCHYRVLELEKLGLRERLIPRLDGPREKIASGQFALICEKIETLEQVAPDHASKLYGRRMAGKLPPAAGSPLPRETGRGRDSALKLCRNCNCYVHREERRCVHCQHDIALADENYYRNDRQYRTLIEAIESALEV